jgi:HCOMODA/2-hydroxy-3-carboxy-muconic semialdehyde decarboxylase
MADNIGTTALDRAAADLVAANRILLQQGIVDGFGHVSVRHPGRPDRFLLSRNLAPAQVRVGDILAFDFQGAPVEATGAALYLERFIHAALYRARPDVGAVVHSHSRAVIPFGACANVPLRPISHMSGFLGAGAPCFEIRQVGGNETDMLIRDMALGDALARALGDAPVVLMRGHGATAVGRDLPQAVFHAVYTEWNAHIQRDTLALGEANYLTPQEARAAAASNDGQVGRAWNYWRSLVESEL